MQTNDKLHREIIVEKQKINIKTFSINGNEITNLTKIQLNSIINNTSYNIIYNDCKYIIRGANPSNSVRVTWHC